MVLNFNMESYMFGYIITCKLNRFAAAITSEEDHNKISNFRTSFRLNFRNYYLQRFNELISDPKVNFSDGKLILLLNTSDIDRRKAHGENWNYDWQKALYDVIQRALNATFTFNQNELVKSK